MHEPIQQIALLDDEPDTFVYHFDDSFGFCLGPSFLKSVFILQKRVYHIYKIIDAHKVIFAFNMYAQSDIFH